MTNEHRCLLCVPFNDQGITDLDYDRETENNKYIPFPYEEYEYMMFKTDLFDVINMKCNLLIDDYEDETIQKDNFEAVRKIVKGHENFIPAFMCALNIAEKYNTFLEVVL